MKAMLPCLIGLLCALGLNADAQTTEEYNIGGPITGLNTSDQADTYPWISSDGLRLYFTKSDASGEGRLYLSTRSSVDAAFTTSVAALPGFDDDQSSCWLDADELTIYFASNYTLKRASRASTDVAFGTPVSVTLNGMSGLVIGPTLTADGSELILTGQGITYLFTNTAPDVFAYVGPLPTGLSDQGPCKFSADGLQLWTSADLGGIQRPCRLTRAALGDDFANPAYFTSSIITAGSSWNQPHFTANGGEMVMTRNEGTFVSNQLYLAERTDWTAVGMIGSQDFQLWPNPAADVINLQLPGTATGRIERIRIVDAQGRLAVDRSGGLSYLTTVDVSAIDAGAYVFEAWLDNGTRLTEQVVVVR